MIVAADHAYAVTAGVTATLLLIAALVGIGARLVRVPYTTALIVVGVGLSLTNLSRLASLSPELIFLGFLPPLLFEGALNVDLIELRRRRWDVAWLALGGTLITAGMTALLLTGLTGMPLRYASVLAILIAPTDPVTVIAVCKEFGVVHGLRTLLEGESLFNDAIAAALTVVLADAAFPDRVTPTVWAAGATLGLEIVVGIAAGVAVGFVAHRLMRLVDDHQIEITLSLVAAYAAFLIADQVHGSGVLAVVIAGLLIANLGGGAAMSEASRVAQINVWEIIAFLANSALFLMIGLSVRVHDFTEHKTWIASVVVIVASTIGRAVSTAPLALSAHVPRSWLVSIWWGGLRGGVPIALALGLGHTRVAGVNVTAVVFAAVVWSLVVPAPTYRVVLRRSGLAATASSLPDA